MQHLNIFIGSTAQRWSESINGNKLLLGNRLDFQYNSSVLTLEDFPTNELKEYSKYSEYLKLLADDYTFYLDFQKQDHSKYLLEIGRVAKDYDNISVIVASGGLFGNTLTPLVLSILEKTNKNVQLIIQQTNIAFLKERELRLVNYINKYYKTSIDLVQIKNIHHQYGNQKLDVIFNDFDKLAITQINH